MEEKQTIKEPLYDPNQIGSELLISEITGKSFSAGAVEFPDWFESRKRAHTFKLNRIPFSELINWHFDSETGNLCHASGKFFSIDGIHVTTNYGNRSTWTQPIINQPEIGILGIITKKINGVMHFLMQAKMEPGNINMIQLAPTLQATRSNFTRVHQGKAPTYLEYFIDPPVRTKKVVDVLQSEQGARFLRKRNRNIIIYIEDDIPVYDDFIWLTLGQIRQVMRQDNIVNMDARTVLSGLNYGTRSLPGAEIAYIINALRESWLQEEKSSLSHFHQDLLESTLNTDRCLHTIDEIIAWFTEQKFRYELDVRHIPLNEVTNWEHTEYDIHHEEDKYFKVIACSVEAQVREVPSWTQPLVESLEPGIIGMLIKKINGIYHFLIQAKVEPGCVDIVEMAPTVQAITGSYKDAPKEFWPPFLEQITSADKDRIRYDTLQSEEGGRFFREENRNIIVEIDQDQELEIPDNYIWMTMNQIKEFIKYNNFVNVQARCLISCLGFI